MKQVFKQRKILVLLILIGVIGAAIAASTTGVFDSEQDDAMMDKDSMQPGDEMDGDRMMKDDSSMDSMESEDAMMKDEMEK